MSTRETVTIQSPADRDQIARWARNVEAGTVVTFRKKSRSSEQSAKMWAMLKEVSDQVEWYGQKLESTDWKDIFSASLRHARVVPGIDKGTFVPLGMHTSTMTIEEMSNLIELIYAFGAEQGVIFKDPKEQNTNSGDPSHSPSPDTAGEVPPSTASPATLLECAREFLALAIIPYDTPAEIDLVFRHCKEEWDGKFPDCADTVKSIATRAYAVATGKRTIDQARSFLSETLGCSIEELGGKANG